MILEKKKLLNLKYVLIFSKTHVWNISYSKKNWARNDKKCALVCIYFTRYSYQILMKLEFSLLVFEKIYSNNKFRELGAELFHVDW
jgi:hypothetical protein